MKYAHAVYLVQILLGESCEYGENNILQQLR